jgi:hypothetical protein
MPSLAKSYSKLERRHRNLAPAETLALAVDRRLPALAVLSTSTLATLQEALPTPTADRFGSVAATLPREKVAMSS